MKRDNFIIVKFLLLVAISFSLPAFLRFNIETDKHNRSALQKDLEATQPDYIFLGNSMLNSRIDPNYFNELTNSKSYIIWHGGVTSAVWYLIFKNVISEADIKPRAVFVFFRDTYLTEAKYRTGGEYKRYINMYSGDDEPLVQSLISQKRDYRDVYIEFIMNVYPILDKNSYIRSKISELAENITKSFKLTMEFKKENVNEILSFEKFRQSNIDGENINASGYRWNYDFSEALQESFLPHLIAAAEEKKIKLEFVRVQKRPLENNSTSNNNELEFYILELRRYLESRNCRFYDFTGNKRITKEMYGPGDHIDEKNKKIYTEIFVDTIKDIL